EAVGPGESRPRAKTSGAIVEPSVRPGDLGGIPTTPPFSLRTITRRHSMLRPTLLCATGVLIGASALAQGITTRMAPANPTVLAPSGGPSTSSILPPPEDDCSTAVTLVGPGPYNFDTTLNTQGVQGQANTECLIGTTAQISADAWYIWTAPSTGLAKLTT